MQVVLSCFDLPHTKTLLSGSTVVEQGLLSRIIPSDAASCNYDGTGLTWSARSSLLFPFLASYRSLYNEIETMVDGLVGLVRKERNYDCFDDQRYNEVDDVEVLAHNVCFVLLQGI